jgi:hypothetical protein
LGGGLNTIQLAFSETMSSGEGFSFDYLVTGGVSATGLPATWTMMLIGLAGFGLLLIVGRGRWLLSQALADAREPRGQSLGGTPPCGGAPDRAEGMIGDLDTSQIHRNWPAMIGLSPHAATKLDRQP